MARSNTTTATATVTNSREDFVREYMEKLATTRKPKTSLVDRLALFAEDRLVGAVRNSKRSAGRLVAAWEIADTVYDRAYAEEHARYAEQLARELGL